MLAKALGAREQLGELGPAQPAHSLPSGGLGRSRTSAMGECGADRAGAQLGAQLGLSWGLSWGWREGKVHVCSAHRASPQPARGRSADFSCMGTRVR